MATIIPYEPTLEEQHEHLQTLVRMLLNDLPTKRDWLDPFLERCLRQAVNDITQ